MIKSVVQKPAWSYPQKRPAGIAYTCIGVPQFTVTAPRTHFAIGSRGNFENANRRPKQTAAGECRGGSSRRRLMGFDMGKLKPCPFCGKKATIGYYEPTEGHGLYSASCGWCSMSPSTPDYITEQKAIDAWNTRDGKFTRDEISQGLRNLLKDFEKSARIFTPGEPHI